MAISSQQVAVTSTPAALNTADPSGSQLLYLKAAAAGVFVGPAGVSTTTGLELPSGAGVQPLEVQLDPGDVIFGVTSATGTVQVLRT